MDNYKRTDFQYLFSRMGIKLVIDQADHPTLNESYPFRVRFDPIAYGSTGNIANVKVQISWGFTVEGNKQVALEPSPGNPIINGQTTILNCIGQQQSYTPVSLPPNWNFTGWTMTNNLQQVGSSTNPITLKGVNTTYSGQQALTAQFQFSTGGVVCGTTKSVTKPIWVGKPSAGAQVVDGSSYWPGYQICPGNHWVGMTWNGLVNSVAWTVPPGISYYTNNTICNFTFPTSGSAVAISVNATNTCGTSSNASYYLSKKTFGCGSFMVSSYPNPASDEITIQSRYTAEGFDEQEEIIPDEIILINAENLTMLKTKPAGLATKINTSKLAPGSYVLKVRFGESVTQQHVLIKGK